MIAVIDNYDSFTYNLVQILGSFGAHLEVYRNDRITVADLAMRPVRGLVISPGPSSPDRAGISIEAVRAFERVAPVLGVCLGHQAIGAAYGGRIGRAPKIMHGKTSQIRHFDGFLYRGVPSPFTATRYHSLIVENVELPSCLQVTALDEDGTIMGVRHRLLDVEGVQFHPESVLTPAGSIILKNFLDLCYRKRSLAVGDSAADGPSETLSQAGGGS